MSKIVNIVSRNEITKLPFSEKDAHAAARALFDAKIEPETFALLLDFIGNNSGVASFVGTLSANIKKSKKAGK